MSEVRAQRCEHAWIPLSFVFETQLLDKEGRVFVRQPDLKAGRVYCVCMKCRRHTYVTTKWAGFYLGDPDDANGFGLSTPPTSEGSAP